LTGREGRGGGALHFSHGFDIKEELSLTIPVRFSQTTTSNSYDFSSTHTCLQVKVMWGIFDDLLKTQNLSGDNSVSLERSLAVYKQRVARRSGSNSSLESGASSTDGGPIML